MANTEYPNELERLQEWARIGLAMHVAANAVITMRYPEAAVSNARAALSDRPQAEGEVNRG